MILSGLKIQKKMGKEIIIDPFDPRKINPNSYNLTLHNELLVYDNQELDMKRENTAHRIRRDMCPCWKAGLRWDGWGFSSM